MFIIASFLGCGQELPPEYKHFFDLPLERQHEVIRTFPVEKQLTLYFYAADRHPPDHGFAYDIAEGGTEIIPLLMDRLRAERSEYNQSNIIRIFEALALKGYLRDREDVLALIRQTVSAMNYDKAAKEVSQRALEYIESKNEAEKRSS